MEVSRSALSISPRNIAWHLVEEVSQRSFACTMNDVYDVLFVEQLGEGVFRRVGIGRIMSKQIEKEFDGSEKEILMLV